MARRKTIQLNDLIIYCNRQLARTDSAATMEFKSGICVMAEYALHQADAYNGYSHNDCKDCEIDTPGYYNRIYYLF